MAIGKPILEGSSFRQKRSKTQILTLSDPKIRGQDPKTLSKRAHNPYGLESNPYGLESAKPDLQSGFKKPGAGVIRRASRARARTLSWGLLRRVILAQRCERRTGS